MLKRVLVFAGLIAATQVNAQPWLENVNVEQTKLQDIVAAYEAKKEAEIEEAKVAGEPIKEKKYYHFYRWLSHAESHTDKDGYLVPATKNYEEWKKYYGNAQGKTTAATTSTNWTFQGPTTSTGGYSGVGRINAIGFHPTDPNHIWVATAGGGAWRTLNNGASWASMSHMLPVLGVSDIDIHPTNPQIIYMCTGDKNASDTYSIGVMKSTNGGTTWDTTGLKWTVTQSRLTNTLVINKQNPNTIIVATSNGIYRSTNAGVTFVQEKTGNYKEIVYHPTDSNILYATGSALVSRSANGGDTWTDISGFTGKGRIAVAVTPNNVAVVKLVVSNTANGLDGIYNSTDTGKTYSLIYQATGSGCNGNILVGANSGNGCGGQGWYDLCIAIDPANVNNVTVGGVNTWYSTNGGTSWTISTNWYSVGGIATVHADKHYMSYHPLVAGRLLQANDGGIYRTDAPMGKNSIWTDMTNGLGITQFYRNAISPDRNFQLAGAQDNGTKGLRNTTWTDENGGDGMDCQIDFSDSTIYYCGVQNGSITRKMPSSSVEISDNIPPGSGFMSNKGAWITPYIVNPHNPMHIIAGYRQVYVSADRGNSWISLSNGDSLNKTQNIHRLAMTPADNKTLYAITNQGGSDTAKVYYTFSYSATTPVTFNVITSPYRWRPTDIKVDPKKKDRFWLTFGGYGSPQVVEYNAGVWTSKKVGLPDVPVQCIEVDSSNGFMYVGTDIGVYHWDTTSNQWEVFNNSKAMPSIEVTDLGINYKKRELWASTYGRGLWKSAIQLYQVPVDTTDTTDTTTIVHIIPYSNRNLSIYPNPNNGVFEVKTDMAKYAGIVADVRIVDNTGRTVWKNKQAISEAGTMYIRAIGLPVGVYILDVSHQNNVIGRQRLAIE